MAGLTLHLATPGHFVPPTNDGSQPLALGSEYHLGPDLGIFGVALSPDLGFVDYNALFDPEQNPLVVQVTHDQLSVVHGTKPNAMSPFNIILNIGGVCYKLPSTVSRRIRSKRSTRIYWQSTLGASGSFRFCRDAPAVF